MAIMITVITPSNRVLYQTLMVAQLVNTFPVLYAVLSFVTVLTIVINNPSAEADEFSSNSFIIFLLYLF